MNREDCATCNSEGHEDSDTIWVEGKRFCPVTKCRIMSEEEWEDLTDSEFEEANKEKIQMVKPATPAKWKIVKEA